MWPEAQLEEFSPTRIPGVPFSCYIANQTGLGFKVRPHWHEHVEILSMLAGEILVHTPREDHRLIQGDLLFLDAREIHAIEVLAPRETRYIVLKMEPGVLFPHQGSEQEIRSLMPFTLGTIPHQKKFSHEELAPYQVATALEVIHQEYQTRGYGFELAIRAQIHILFLGVLRYLHQKGANILGQAPQIDGSSFQKLQKVFDYLDRNFSRDLSARLMAQECGMSYSHFCRKFQALTRQTFSHYLNQVRINEAQKLLVTSDLSVTEVATHCGFSTSSYFIHQFKLRKNGTPLEFRKRFTEGATKALGET